MGDDFGSYDKPTPLERADNPMMAETPKFNFPDDPSRQEQSDKFFKVKRSKFQSYFAPFFRLFTFRQLNSTAGVTYFKGFF